MKLCLLLILFSTSLSAYEIYPNGYDATRDVIAENYEAGPFLIYDCKEGHYVCVLSDYYKKCEADRADDLIGRKLNLSCAPIGEFPNKKSCFQRQLFMTSQAYGPRFCISDYWKQKEISY